MNPKELKAAMKRNDDTQEKLAEALGLQTSGVSERINGRIQFRRNEIDIIRQRYNLSDADTIMIFFADDVSYKDAERRKN
jgi:transcriptional regulator with XRE-family HTH domain